MVLGTTRPLGGLISNKLHLTDWFITLVSFELLVKRIFSVFLRWSERLFSSSHMLTDSNFWHNLLSLGFLTTNYKSRIRIQLSRITSEWSKWLLSCFIFVLFFSTLFLRICLCHQNAYKAFGLIIRWKRLLACLMC